MSDVSQWNVAAASNNAAPPHGAPEGLAPSTINDILREVMAALARWYSDSDGTLTSAGTGNAYTLTTNGTHAALADMPLTAFRVDRANTAAATLNVDGLGAKSMRVNGSALVSGQLVADKILLVAYNATDDAYDVFGVTTTINNSNWSGTELAVANGGTGSTTAAGARTSLGLGALSVLATVSNDVWSGADLAVINGGTGASDAATARANLGLAALAILATVNNDVWSGADLAVVNGGTGGSDAATARTNLGLGTASLPNFAGLNVGHASDTTITRDGAGQIAVEGAAVFTHNSTGYVSSKIFVSTSAPTGGDDGDVWFKHEA